MADLDLTKFREQLRTLPDSAVAIEELFQKDHPGSQRLSAVDRYTRAKWLIDQLELPDRFEAQCRPDDEHDQSEWTIFFTGPAGSGDDQGTIKLYTDTYFGVSHWLMTYGYV